MLFNVPIVHANDRQRVRALVVHPQRLRLHRSEYHSHQDKVGTIAARFGHSASENQA